MKERSVENTDYKNKTHDEVVDDKLLEHFKLEEGEETDNVEV